MENQHNYLKTEPKKEQSKHAEFLDRVFVELQNFNVEQQVEILHSLYTRLKSVYEMETEDSLKTVELYKEKLTYLKQIEPKDI